MPNKVYLAEEAQTVFGSEAGDDVAWTTESVGDGAGRQSATHDLGAAPRADRYLLEVWAQFAATPTVGNAARVYIKEYGSTSATPDHPTNDDGAGDIAVSAEDKLKNLDHVGSIIVDEAAANVEMGFKAIVEIPVRHIALVLWNASGASTTSDAAETKARLTPIPPEIQ